MQRLSICEECLRKQRIIDQQTEEIARLRKQLHQRQRRAEEGPFGSSTPSSKLPFKTNSVEENQNKKGGARPGHPGHGRNPIEVEGADRVHEVDVSSTCPQCGSLLQDKGFARRSVIDSRPIKAERIVYHLKKRYCPKCRKAVQAQAPGVLPKGLYGNQLITQLVFWHYLHGIPMGRVCDQAGIGLGAVVDIFHRLAFIFRGVIPKLVQEYRSASVRHADETSWRTDGRSGYAWLFATERSSIFLFRSTRAASVPKEILGTENLGGVLVVDRYNGYNRAPCSLQYCYAHLLREVEDLAKEAPDNSEVIAFTSTLIPLLSQAMHLHSQPIPDGEYYAQAQRVQQQIVRTVQSPARHLGIRHIQDIFTDNAHRLYHWVTDRRVPADNNRAERELRPTVIARKVSFGSQSDAGARTREVLVTLLHTLKKRVADPQSYFKSILDKLALDPKADPLTELLRIDTS